MHIQELLAFKLGAITGTFLVALLATLTPRIVYSCTRRRQIHMDALSCLACFAGMMIGSVGLSHVLMNSIDAFNLYQPGLAYEYATTICSLVVFVCWIIEKVTNRRLSTPTLPHAYLTEDATDPHILEPYTFGIALMIDGVMEGLVLGAASSDGTLDSMITVLVTLLCLKGLEGLVIGTLFQQQDYGTFAYTMISIAASLPTPIGIGLGFLLTNMIGKYTPLIAGAVTAISAGVFMYVGWVCMVQRELTGTGKVKRKLLCCFLGWLFSAAIAWFA